MEALREVLSTDLYNVEWENMVHYLTTQSKLSTCLKFILVFCKNHKDIPQGYK